ncbi:MAG: hypothetical protein AAF724_21680 [Pseudomonadota bacterium]
MTVRPGETVRPFLIAGLTYSLTMSMAFCCTFQSSAATSAAFAMPGIQAVFPEPVHNAS